MGESEGTLCVRRFAKGATVAHLREAAFMLFGLATDECVLYYVNSKASPTTVLEVPDVCVFSSPVLGSWVGVRRLFHRSLFLTASRMVLPKILVLTARTFARPSKLLSALKSGRFYVAPIVARQTAPLPNAVIGYHRGRWT